jgi:hypothetical protein
MSLSENAKTLCLEIANCYTEPESECNTPPPVLMRFRLTTGETATVFFSYTAGRTTGVIRLSVRVLVPPNHDATDCEDFLHIFINSFNGVWSYANAFRTTNMICTNFQNKQDLFSNAKDTAAWIFEQTVWNTNLVHRVEMTQGGTRIREERVEQGAPTGGRMKTTDQVPEVMDWKDEERAKNSAKVRTFARNLYSEAMMAVHEVSFRVGGINIVTVPLTHRKGEKAAIDVKYPHAESKLTVVDRFLVAGTKSEVVSRVAELERQTAMVKDYANSLSEALDEQLEKRATLEQEAKEQEAAEAEAATKAKEQEAAEAEAATKAKDKKSKKRAKDKATAKSKKRAEAEKKRVAEEEANAELLPRHSTDQLQVDDCSGAKVKLIPRRS